MFYLLTANLEGTVVEMLKLYTRLHWLRQSSGAINQTPYCRRSSRPVSILHLHIQNPPCDRERRWFGIQAEGY